MHHSPFAHKIQYLLCTLAPPTRPRQVSPDRNPAIRPRMHQPLQLACNKPIVDEEIFFHTELGITPFQIAGTILFDSVPQDQVLRSRRRTNRIRLHEFHPMQRAFQLSR